MSQALVSIGDQIDRSFVIDLAKRFIETPSPTGHEEYMARLLVELFDDLGLNSELSTIYEGRFNAIGRLPGTSTSAPTVLLSGHMDTSVRGDEEWLVGRGWKNKATVVDREWVYGNGIFNMKAAFVSYIALVEAMRRRGISLPGELILAGTSGEIELASVEEFVGAEYDSYGMGMRHLLVHGVAADYQIIGEPCGLVPRTGTMGTVWAKITTKGTFAHTAFADKQTSAIEEMMKLWRGLDPWIDKYRSENEYDGILPQVNRAAIRGGRPWRAARTPATCSMYVDIRFPPDRFPIDVQREVREAVQAAGSDLQEAPEITFYISRPGTTIPKDHPAMMGLLRGHKVTFNESPAPTICPPFCADAIDANRLGVPTAIYGPAGRTPNDATTNMDDDHRKGEGEFASIEDMIRVAQVYGIAVYDLNVGGVETVIGSRFTMPGYVT